MTIEWVAELGSLHKQDLSLACEMARQAVGAGATVVKIQLGKGEPGDETRRVNAGLAFGLRDYCKHLGMELLASVFSNEGLALAQDVNLRRYKVAAETAEKNPALVQRMLADGKDMIVSASPARVREIWGSVPAQVVRNIYCVSKYPTYPWEQTLPEKFGKEWWGYSDHLHGVAGCLLAVARGAQYVEAHFTLDKTDLWTKDSAFAKSPGEFAEMVRLGNEIGRLLEAGNG